MKKLKAFMLVIICLVLLWKIDQYFFMPKRLLSYQKIKGFNTLWHAIYSSGSRRVFNFIDTDKFHLFDNNLMYNSIGICTPIFISKNFMIIKFKSDLEYRETNVYMPKGNKNIKKL